MIPIFNMNIYRSLDSINDHYNESLIDDLYTKLPVYKPKSVSDKIYNIALAVISHFEMVTRLSISLVISPFLPESLLDKFRRINQISQEIVNERRYGEYANTRT